MEETTLYVLTDMEDNVVAMTEDLDTAKSYSFFRTHKFCEINSVFDKRTKYLYLKEYPDLMLTFVDAIGKFVTEKDYRMYFQDMEIVSADLAMTRNNLENIVRNSAPDELSSKDIKALVRTIQIINTRMRDSDKLMIDIERGLN